MRKPSETLTIHSAVKDWYRVETDDGDEHFVAGVKIAGVGFDAASGRAKLEVDEDGWSIEGEYEPVLLVEPPRWYSPPESDENDGPVFVCSDCGVKLAIVTDHHAPPASLSDQFVAVRTRSAVLYCDDCGADTEFSLDGVDRLRLHAVQTIEWLDEDGYVSSVNHSSGR